MEPGGLIVLVALFVLFWLFIVRPQRRRAQEQRVLHESIAVGDEVVTLGGLLGRVRAIDEEDDTLEVEIAPGTNVRVVRRGVAAVIAPEKSHEEFIRNE
ncbi:MAG TPA: preprotein translocase subunit YajC [Gaiellaceae bacterium]|nr:preprotein translocase subunit YajC [Gaiellaceae bacterium]